MKSLTRYILAYGLSNLLMSCGSNAPSVIKVGGGANPTPIIAVQLNDMWNQTFPSEGVDIVDARHFTPPSVITVVGGSYAGSSPGQYLHARLTVNNEQCDYQANTITDSQLTLQYCSGGIGPNVYLPAGSYLELVNFDAPGFLLEAHFNLVL